MSSMALLRSAARIWSSWPFTWPSLKRRHRKARRRRGSRQVRQQKKTSLLRPSSANGLRGVRCHGVRGLHPDDITIVDAIPVTTVHRALLDLAEVSAGGAKSTWMPTNNWAWADGAVAQDLDLDGHSWAESCGPAIRARKRALPKFASGEAVGIHHVLVNGTPIRRDGVQRHIPVVAREAGHE